MKKVDVPSSKNIVPEKDQAALIIHLLNKFTAESELDDLLRPCLEGHPVV